MHKRTLLFFAIILLFMMTSCSSNSQPNKQFEGFASDWNDQSFDAMYEYISSSAKSEFDKDTFVERHEKVFSDLSISDFEVTFEPLTKSELKSAKKHGEVIVTFSVSMDTIAGPAEFTYDATLLADEKGKDWVIDWDEGFIFPELKDGGTVSVQEELPRRGEILDRNRMPLAMNDTVYEVGIIPEKFANVSEAGKERLAQLLNMNLSTIEEKLNEDWVEDHLFVPLQKLTEEKFSSHDELWTIEGVTNREVIGRIYPAGKAASHLIGYIGQVNAEELEENKDKGYTPTDSIGKRGAELLFEEQLRGEKGLKIVVTNQDGEKFTVAEKPVKNGESVELTIDINVQEKIYEAYNKEAGTAAAVHPKTGETIALVSSPGFDPHEFVYSMNEATRTNLETDPQQPLINRFTATYAPGSVFKPITSAIGLKNGSLNPDEGVAINGLTWGKEGWGNYKVRRVSSSYGPVDLDDALVRSDNIYFAMKAVDMGIDKYTEGLKAFGFEEDIPFIYPFRQSTISSTGELESEVDLANTSYGQAQVEMSSLHIALAYSPILNDGNMVKPTLLKSEETGEIWKKDLLSKEHTEYLQNSLRRVVTNGTAKRANREGFAVSGKTGTAELKSGSNSAGHENGWFVGYPTEEQDLIIALMIEHAEHIGTSSLAASTVADILEYVYTIDDSDEEQAEEINDETEE